MAAINLRAMRSYQWFVLFLVALVTAANIGEESRARMKLLCFIANHRWSPLSTAVARLQAIKRGCVELGEVGASSGPHPTTAAGAPGAAPIGSAAVELHADDQVDTDLAESPPRYWLVKYWSLTLLQSCRAAMMMLVVCSVPVFILRDSSDPVSIVLNTLSVLFILEVCAASTSRARSLSAFPSF